MEKKRPNLILVLIVLASFLLMGQTGCATTPSQAGSEGTTAASTSASNQGLDFNLNSGVRYLSEGITVNQGDTLQIVAHVENYKKNSKSGQLCIRDDIEDNYGGVQDKCLPFTVPAAQVDQNGKVTQPGQVDTPFPSQSEYYSYHDFPVTQQAHVFLTAQYVEETVIKSGETGVPVPTPQTETISLVQEPAPISMSIEKTISPRENGYLVDLGMTLNNQVSNAEIWTPDFKTKGVFFTPLLGSNALDCGLTSSLVPMDSSTKYIKCSALVSSQQTRYYLLVDLAYGVKLSKSFAFTIKGENKA